ncbi:MAG: hypothetical protein CMH26_03690 [Micavibrio sp.]|nr:hypothetical protein [Micavibrio sp.]|tara:strand:- start:2583 stop:2951 length:369 start_codon:yes stop_codon:yes gene_type:complete
MRGHAMSGSLNNIRAILTENGNMKFLSGVFFTTGIFFISKAHIKNTTDMENTISIYVPKDQREELKKGSGDPAELYKIFAEQVDPLITAGGRSATVEVTVDGDVTLIQHAPKAPLVLEPSGS